MQLTLIRHLPTEWNQKTWLQGRRDIELTAVTDEIKQEIVKNQKLLGSLSPFDLVLASTLKRTQQTAYAYGFTAETDYLLDELDFGPYEGVSKKILMDECGEKWIHHPEEVVLGESLVNFKERIVFFLQKYRDFANILVFGHGAWIRAMISYLYYGDINHMNKIPFINNACITLTWDARWER